MTLADAGVKLRLRLVPFSPPLLFGAGFIVGPWSPPIEPKSPAELVHEPFAEKAGPELGEFELGRDGIPGRLAPMIPNVPCENLRVSGTRLGDSEAGDSPVAVAWSWRFSLRLFTSEAGNGI